MTIRVQASGNADGLRTVRLPAGRRRARSRSAARGSPRGRYTVEIEARDARGNRAAVQRTTVRVDADEPRPLPAAADAWSRRDFMRNGFGSLALVCTFGAERR